MPLNKPTSAQLYAPLIDRDAAFVLEPRNQSHLGELLAAAQNIAGGNDALPEAAIARRSEDMAFLQGQRFAVLELSHRPHALMLYALLNALPVADVSEQPNVINDTSGRDDFENVCPVRFLAIFPMGTNADYLVLYDVKPRVLQPAAFKELCELALKAGRSIDKCE